MTTNATSANWTFTSNSAGATFANGTASTSGKIATVNATEPGSVTVKAVADGYADASHTIVFNAVPTNPEVDWSGVQPSEGYTGVSYSFTASSLNISNASWSWSASPSSYTKTENGASCSFVFSSATTYTVTATCTNSQDAEETASNTTNIAISASSSTLSLDKTTLNLATTKTGTITPTVVNVGSYTGTTVSVSTSNSGIASISSSSVSSGNAVTITAGNNEGSATITFTCNGQTKTCTVNVVKVFSVTYSVTGKTSASVTGNNPASSYSYSQTYNTVKQLTGGNSATFTINVKTAITLDSFVMNLASNASQGKGNLSYKIDSGTETFIIGENSSSAIGFNTWGDNTTYGTTYRDVTFSTMAGKVINSKLEVFVRCVTTNSIYVDNLQLNFAKTAASITSSPSSLTLSKAASGVFTITPHDFLASDANINYSASVVDGTYSSYVNFSVTGNAITATAGSTPINDLEIRITATDNGSVESATTTVSLTISETTYVLDSIRIATAPAKTTYSEGNCFDPSGMVVVATFVNENDDEDSYENDVSALVSYSPSTSTALETNNTYVRVSYTSGLITKTADQSITVNAKIWYSKITDVSKLYDGQKVVITAGEDFIAQNYGDDGKSDRIANVEIDELDGTNKISENKIDELEGAIYTIGRLKVGTKTVYTLKDENDLYIYNANTSSNTVSAVSSFSDNFGYWEISYNSTNDNFDVTNLLNDDKGVLCFNTDGTNHIFRCYGTLGTYVAPSFYALDSEASASSVANSFEKNRMLMDSYDSEHHTGVDGDGYCKDSEHAYYAQAKAVWNAMSENERKAVSSDAKDRLQAWASANGDSYDKGYGDIASSRAMFAGVESESNSSILIIIVSAFISVTAVGGFFFLRKKKEQ